MPFIRDSLYLRAGYGVAFDYILSPGFRTPFSGIYRCEGCGFEIASTKRQTLPADDHKGHGLAHGPIRWRLVAQTMHERD
jgi:hypothetical protein